MAAGRRLGALAAHVVAEPAATTEVDAAPAVVDEQWVRPQDELHAVAPLPPPDEALMRALSRGELDVRGLPPDTVRSMMRPEPTQPSETEANMSGFMPYHGTTRHNFGQPKLPLPELWDDAAGGVSGAAVERLAELQREAAEAEEYEQAKTLKQLIRVLGPQPRRGALDCAPSGVEAKAQFFFDNGFVVCARPPTPFPPAPPALRSGLCRRIENVIEADALQRLQAAWLQVEAEVLPEWEEARSHGVGISRHAFASMDDGRPGIGRKTTGFDFKRLLALEPAALDPVDNPETLDVLSRVLVGPENYDYHFYSGELRCTGAGPAIYALSRATADDRVVGDYQMHLNRDAFTQPPHAFCSTCRANARAFR